MPRATAKKTTAKKTTAKKIAPRTPKETKLVSSSRERDNSTIEGYELIKRVKYALEEHSENSEDAFLQRIGLTRQYWNSFCNGTRPIQALVRNSARRKFLAQFLCCSQLEIRILAGEITPDELVAEESDALWLEMEKMRRDTRWSMLTPNNKDEWDDLPTKYRILIVSMYRSLTEKDLKKAYKQASDTPSTVEAL